VIALTNSLLLPSSFLLPIGIFVRFPHKLFVIFKFLITYFILKFEIESRQKFVSQHLLLLLSLAVYSWDTRARKYFSI
jgi:hypothetical protein